MRLFPLKRKILNSGVLYIEKQLQEIKMSLTITPNFQIFNNQQPKNSHNNIVMPSKLSVLKADTVSFGAKSKMLNEVSNTFKDIVMNDYENKIPSYQILSIKFMDTLESVANKLKDFGISFDRTYCEKNPVKGSGSYYSKFLRSGATPADQIRATFYMENPYDLGIINNQLLPELKIRGYELDMIPDEMSGKRVKSRKPDFDVRLADITEKDTEKLDKTLQKSISKPQKSGYEDIQMRLIDTLAPIRKRPAHELLILFGKNYAEAKHNESYYVYDITRALKNELHIAQVQNPELHSPAKRVQDNIKIISGQLNNFISKPLFINAKNLDFYKDPFQLPVELGKSTCEALMGLVEGIRNKIPLHYKAEMTMVNSDEFKPELERLVKASPEFKARKDKNVYVIDIKNKKLELLKQLKEHKADDLKIIKDVQIRLAETIEKYGEKTSAADAKSVKNLKSE